MLQSQGSATAPTVLPRARCAIVVVDVVESVRLMQDDEEGFIGCWLGFVDVVRQQVLPRFEGRLVKSLGDGMLLVFDSVADAAHAALEMHDQVARCGLSGGAALQLRCGMHVAEVVVGEHDIFGAGVNLGARLATLAGPGQTVVSTAVRDELVAGLDAELDDLGECYVKHLEAPVRAFRLAPAPGVQVAAPARAASAGAGACAELRAMVAVLPFRRLADADADTDAAGPLGDWIAEGSTVLLSRAPTLRVVSHLSTAVFRTRRLPLPEMAARLGADYVLSGNYVAEGDRVNLLAELAEARSGEVVWAEHLATLLADLLSPDSQAFAALVAGVQGAVMLNELSRSTLQAPPSLRSYSLQISAIAMMHRSGRDDFERAALQLQHLIERHPRLAAPRAWLAQWHVLRVTRGLIDNTEAEAAPALDHTRRALDADPQCSLALTMRGFVECHMLRDLERAWHTLDTATTMNPSDSLAWLFKGVVQAFQGNGSQALEMVLEAGRLSPLDPLRDYYDALSATAALAAQDYPRAAAFALRSVRANRAHSPTWRALVIAQSELGQLQAARASLQQLLVLEPRLTVRSYLERSPSGANETRRRYAEALQRAGLAAA
ncbi:MAG: adenylate/guanylate cyclase domain-containing protein [Rubrivivax sp.]|nr:adenylate/guanylate cyclase domain-containing protein [Rubrivivax sp.]